MTISERIGHIRRAIIRGKREIGALSDEFLKQEHNHNIDLLLNIINKKQDIISQREQSVIIEIEQALKDTNANELGIDLLEILQTMDLAGLINVH